MIATERVDASPNPPRPSTTYERRLASGERASTSEAPSMNALAPRRLSHRMRVIAHMAALGLSNREIATRLGYTEGRISIILRATEVTAEVERTRKEIFSRSDAQALVTMLPKAYETIWGTLSDVSEKQALRVDTAFRILERVHGKPKQAVEVGGTLLKDVFALLDKQADALARYAPERAIPVESVESASTTGNAPGARADEPGPDGVGADGVAAGVTHSSSGETSGALFSSGEDAFADTERDEITAFLDEFSGRLGAGASKVRKG